MPARSPRLSEAGAEALARLGESLRLRRKLLGVSAVTTAQAAGLSRTTLHRIEGGEPSVTMGAYLAVVRALGLKLGLADPGAGEVATGEGANIQLADYPELRRLCWHIPGATELSPGEAFEIYERNWRYVDPEALSGRERALIERLSERHGGGRLLVRA